MKKPLFLAALLPLLFGCKQTQSNAETPQPATTVKMATVDGKMPEGTLAVVSYTYGSQMLPTPEIDFSVMTDSSEVRILSFDTDSLSYAIYRPADQQLLDKMLKVIDDNKMYAYDLSYNNPDVLDGDHWLFEALFADSTGVVHRRYNEGIHSSGSNDYPKGDGIEQICRLYRTALQSATLLFVCDAEGKPLTDEEGEPLSDE